MGILPYNQMIDQAFDLEKQGHSEEAISILEGISRGQESNWELLLEIGKMKFRREDYSEALVDFVECANEGKSQDAETIILECYYQPNRQEIETTYNNNRAMLSDYAYYYGDVIEAYTDVDKKLIWQDEAILVIWYLGVYTVIHLNNDSEWRKNGDIVNVVNELDMEALLYVEQRTYQEKLFQAAIYLYYEKVFLSLLLCMEGMEKLLEKERFVFIIGTFGLQKVGQDPQLLLNENSYIAWGNIEYYKIIFLKYWENKEKQKQELEEKVFSYYKNQEGLPGGGIPFYSGAADSPRRCSTMPGIV